MRLVVVSSSEGVLQALQTAIEANALHAKIVLAVLAQPQPIEQQHALTSKIERVVLAPTLDAAAKEIIAQKIQTHQPDLVVWENSSANFMSLLPYFSQKIMFSHPALPGEFLDDDAVGDAYDAFQRGDILYSGITIYTRMPGSDNQEVFLKAGVPMLIEDTLEDFATRMQLASQQLLVKALALYAKKYHPSIVT